MYKSINTYFAQHKIALLGILVILAAFSLGIMPHDAAATSLSFVGVGMTDTITQAFVQQWDTSIRMQAQQTQSRLQKAVVDRGVITGDAFTINTMGENDLDENITRHGDTVWGDPNMGNRLASMKDYYKALPLDRNDIPKMLVNPVTGGDYMRQLIAGKNRKIDAIIYAALGGSIASKDASSTYTLPAAQKIAHGGTGFTKAKIIQARSIFRANEADDEAGEELFCMYNDQAMIDIMSDTNLTSADWMAVKMLQEGKVATNWMGFTWIPYQKVTFSASTYYLYAWAKSGVHFGTGYEEGNVTRRGDKKDLWQVSMGASYGSGRQDENKVVEIAFQ